MGAINVCLFDERSFCLTKLAKPWFSTQPDAGWITLWGIYRLLCSFRLSYEVIKTPPVVLGTFPTDIDSFSPVINYSPTILYFCPPILYFSSPEIDSSPPMPLPFPLFAKAVELCSHSKSLFFCALRRWSAYQNYYLLVRVRYLTGWWINLRTLFMPIWRIHWLNKNNYSLLSGSIKTVGIIWLAVKLSH